MKKLVLVAVTAMCLALSGGVLPTYAEEPAPVPTDDKDRPSEPKVSAVYAEEPNPAPTEDKDRPSEPRMTIPGSEQPEPAPDDKDKPSEPKLG